MCKTLMTYLYVIYIYLKICLNFFKLKLKHVKILMLFFFSISIVTFRLENLIILYTNCILTNNMIFSDISV